MANPPGSSYFLDDRSQPLVNPNPATLNDRLHTQHVDIADQDKSFQANTTRIIAHFVGQVFTPKQVLAILRILKAITLCFIVLIILANIMYILFVEIIAGSEVRSMAGGFRDVVIRVYALILSLIALAIEVDYTRVVKRYSGLKAFVPRALFYIFIAAITISHPVYQQVEEEQVVQQNNNDDDAYANDDANNNNYNAQEQEEVHEVEIPTSAVGFQMVASFVLGCCGIGYIICGLLCLDRFTAKAFLSTLDPLVTTAIGPTNTTSSSLEQEKDFIPPEIPPPQVAPPEKDIEQRPVVRSSDPPGW